MNRLWEVETRSIPEFDFLEFSDRQRALFGAPQVPAATAYMITPDEEGTVAIGPSLGHVQVTHPHTDHAYCGAALSPRSNYQVAIDSRIFAHICPINFVGQPVNFFFDCRDFRREAVGETISALQSEAHNEQTRYSLTREAVLRLFKRYGQRNWKAIFDKLDSYSRLQPGWDSYSARAPQQAAIRSAKLFLSQLTEKDRVPDRVKPSVVGGIGITFRSNNRKCYVEFYNNGTVYALFSDGQTEPETCQVPPTAQNYKLLIQAIQGYLNAGNP